MKRVNGVWFYLGREYGSLHEAMLAARMVLAIFTFLAGREAMGYAHTG